MKRYAFAFAAALAATGPALAGPYDDMIYSPTPMHAAHIELGASLATDGNTNAFQIDGTGRIAGPAFLGLKAEGEAFGAFITSDGSNVTGYGLAAHLYKEGPNHAVGAFAGVVSYDSSSAYLLGGEAKVYLGPMALTGLVGALVPESGSGAWVFNGGLDYYFTPDHKLWGNFAYYVPSSGGSNVWSGSLGLEKRFTGTAWSAFASGSYLTTAGTNIWTGRVGVRAFFDPPGTTLEQHDRLVPFDATSVASFVR